MCLLNAWNNNVISNPNLEHLGPDQSAYLPNDTCFPEEPGFTTSDGYYLMCTWGRRLCFWSRVHQLDPQLYVCMLMLIHEFSTRCQSFGCPLRLHASKHSVVFWFNYELVVIAIRPAVVYINLFCECEHCAVLVLNFAPICSQIFMRLWKWRFFTTSWRKASRDSLSARAAQSLVGREAAATSLLQRIGGAAQPAHFEYFMCWPRKTNEHSVRPACSHHGPVSVSAKLWLHRSPLS